MRLQARELFRLMQTNNPYLLYTFRRCPYAMRARLALFLAGINVSLREIDLQHKLPEFLSTSAKGTVPVLVFDDGSILDESLDIVAYVCAQNVGKFLTLPSDLSESFNLLHYNFSSECLPAIYRYKYPDRYDSVNVDFERSRINGFLSHLDRFLSGTPSLIDRFTQLDLVFMPFMRQISIINQDWFYQIISDVVKSKFEFFVHSIEFEKIMTKYNVWHDGDAEVYLL